MNKKTKQIKEIQDSLKDWNVHEFNFNNGDEFKIYTWDKDYGFGKINMDETTVTNNKPNTIKLIPTLHDLTLQMEYFIWNNDSFEYELFNIDYINCSDILQLNEKLDVLLDTFFKQLNSEEMLSMELNLDVPEDRYLYYILNNNREDIHFILGEEEND